MSQQNTAAAPPASTAPEGSGDAKYDALVKALDEKGINVGGFMSGDENFRKRALKFNTANSEYEKMKEEHQWLFDQPIAAKTEEEQKAEAEEEGKEKPAEEEKEPEPK
jgi:flagellar biosynthesis GTPase FlhF